MPPPLAELYRALRRPRRRSQYQRVAGRRQEYRRISAGEHPYTIAIPVLTRRCLVARYNWDPKGEHEVRVSAVTIDNTALQLYDIFNTETGISANPGGVLPTATSLPVL